MNAQKIRVNLIPGGVIPIIYVSQYDVGRLLQFELYDGMSAATIESGTSIDVRGTKPDGRGFQFECTYSGNVVSIASQMQMTIVSGSIECELNLTKDDVEIGTANFILEVEPAALRSDTDISETVLPEIFDAAQRNQEAAAASAAAAAESESNAADSASAAATSESNAADSASAAATSESNAADSASAAATSESNAADSAAAAATSKSDAEAYAIGKRNGVDVPSSDVTYNNNAKHYAEVAQAAAAGGLIPKGTCTFATLPSLALSSTGDMWNISDDFVTTSDFREGAGAAYGAGSNVYKTSDGKWDVTAGRMVMMQGATASAAGTPGAVEAPSIGQQHHFWTGGKTWDNDTANLITNFTSSDDATTTDMITASGGDTAISSMASGEKHSRLFDKLSRGMLNIRKTINAVKAIWANTADTWKSGRAYAVYDMVIYNGVLYRCLLAHTSSTSGGLIPTNTTYWVATTIGSEISSQNSNYANLSTSKLDASKVEMQAITGMKFYREPGTSDVNIVWKNYDVLYRLKISTSGLSLYHYDGSTWSYIWGK